MRTVNQVTLLGHCGKKPSLNPKRSRLRFRLATSSRFKKEGADSFEVQTDWHDVVVFGRSTIDFLTKNLSAGQPVLVQGRLRSYEIKSQDRTLRAWEVIAEEIVPLPKSPPSTDTASASRDQES